MWNFLDELSQFVSSKLTLYNRIFLDDGDFLSRLVRQGELLPCIAVFPQRYVEEQVGRPLVVGLRDGTECLAQHPDVAAHSWTMINVENRWDEKAGLRTGCGVRSQVIDVLKAQEIKEIGNEEG